MSFATTISQPECGVRFYVKIQGIGDIYLDGAAPVGPTAAWSTPTSKTVGATTSTYTLRERMLDVSDGLRDVGAEINRRSGLTTPGSMTIRLADNRANYLRGLFARDLSTGHVAQMGATLAYDTAGAGATLTVDTTSGWASSGHAYLGRECIRYTSVGATTIVATSASEGSRDVFSLGSDDITYRHNTNKASPQPRLISDYPMTWHGRYVQLFAFLVDQDGRALDSAFDSTGATAHTREVWRGIIQGDPRPEADWKTWTIETKGIDSILHQEVGREPIEGTLIQVPGDKAANNAGIAGSTFFWEPIYYAFFLTDETRFLDLEVTDWLNVANAGTDTGPQTTQYHLEIGSAGTLLTDAGLVSAIRVALGNVASGASPVGTPMGDYSGLGINYGDFNTSKYRCFTCSEFGTRAAIVTFNFDAVGSIGRLINFSGSTVTPLIYQGAGNQQVKTENLQTAVYIGPTATSIPFWYTETGGVQPDQATSTGHARIGEEIVSYTGVSAFTSVNGMYKLTGCKRGQMGTTPKAHTVALDVDWKPQQEAVKVTFGIAFDGVGFLTAVLQLAISTGGTHHGTFDTLPAKIGPALCVHHFDTTAITKIQSGLTPSAWQKVYCFISKPVQLATLLAEWCAPLNLYVTARTGDTGLFRITVDRVLPPLESEPNPSTLGTDRLDGLDPAVWKSGNDLIINRIKADYRWDPMKEGPRDGFKLIATDEDSEYDYGTRGTLDWVLRGHDWGPGEAIANIAPKAADVFARFGKPYDVLELHTDRVGWIMRPGNAITVTVTGAPAPNGSTISSRVAVVVAVSHTYTDPSGSIGSKVTVVLERYVRRSTYSPAARVASTDAGVPSITLTGNQYSLAAETTDAAHFDNGDVVRIWNQGNAATIDVRTLSGKNGNVFTLSAALVNCTVGANTRMIATTYAAAQASQRQHVFIASNAAPGVLTVSDTTAFKYV